MEEKNWSWEQWLNKLADYSVEIPDTYDEFNGKIKATCSLGSSTDIYHIRFERVNYRGETVVNDIYLNNDEMRVVVDFAERLSDKKLVEEKELDKAREEVIKNLIKKIEEANCDSISLELLREINLSKLKQ